MSEEQPEDRSPYEWESENIRVALRDIKRKVTQLADCRAAFEKWAKEKAYSLEANVTQGEGLSPYWSGPTTHAWEGWKAAWQPERESVALTESERSELVQAMAARINFASGEHDYGDSGIYGGGLDVEQASAALNAVLERFELRRRP